MTVRRDGQSEVASERFVFVLLAKESPLLQERHDAGDEQIEVGSPPMPTLKPSAAPRETSALYLVRDRDRGPDEWRSPRAEP